MMITEENRVRTEIINWLAEQPTAFHLTLSFPPNTNHTSTKELLDRFLIHLNRKIFKRRYSTGKNFIDGIVIREKTRQLNTDHYHIMIFDEGNYLPGYDRMHELVEKEVRRLQGRKIRNYIKSFRLQEYYNDNGTDGLEKYLTKNFYSSSFSIQQAMDSMGVLTEYKTVFGANVVLH
ncbi:MAG: hypothetical protein COB36_10025 [Alphaproteobacteria bacterium]|nr:MAG: hypothetical protein COB36_10025 [Alphaproteobacteria bacterium]